LEQVLREGGRQVVEQVFHAMEPPAEQQPSRVRLGGRAFRRNRPTRAKIDCRFGRIQLTRCIYQAVERGEHALAPLEHALGIVAHRATPALADEAARLNADLSQQQTRQVLEQRHAVPWSDGTLRKVVAAMSQHYAPLRQEAQCRRVVELLTQAAKSPGKHAPTLSVGRDGVIIPLRPCWEEASTATITVLDRRGRRLGTVYLGRMPEFGQATLTDQLLCLLKEVFTRWQGVLPRLVYVTDAGTHPQDFFRYRLQGMRHPRTGQKLSWEWIVDYYHACERITKLAEALFGTGVQASRWAATMRRVLRDQSGGVTRVVQRAQAQRRQHGLQRTRKEFDAALNYLKKYRPHMNYAAARRRKLPIGSGVTEAACKTIFGCRFKQSGMRWKKEHGQRVLDLRLILKSGVWTEVRQRWLTSYYPLKPATAAAMPPKTAPNPDRYALPA
jgi:hypothetical protein